MKRLVVMVFLCMMLSAAALHAADGDGITGIWLTSKQEARIEIFRCGETYCGKIVWTNDPVYSASENAARAGQPKTDDNNPDPALRQRPILGLLLVYNIRYAGGNEWSEARIYDPDSGNTYRAKFKLLSRDKLELHGYFLIPLFGSSTIWTRVN